MTIPALKVSPSRVERAEACKASIGRTASIPRSYNKAAQRGTNLHAAAASLFLKGFDAWPGIKAELLSHPENSLDDIPDLNSVWKWAGEQKPDDPDTVTLVEVSLDLAFMGLDGSREDDPEGCRPDLMFISYAQKAAVIIDHKFGVTEVTDPEHNRQFHSYGAGIIANLQDPAWLAKVKKEHGIDLKPLALESVQCVLLQPKAFKADDRVRDHVFSKDELRAKAKEIKAIATAALQPDAPATPGPVVCRWCDAKPACAEYAAMKNGQVQAKASSEAKADAAVTTEGTPIIIQPVAELAGPMVVINAEAVTLAKGFQERIAGMTAHDQASADALGLVAKEARALFNRIDANREKVKKPVLDLGRLIDAEAKKALDPLKQAAADADAKVLAWVKAETAKAEQARKEQEALAAAAEQRRRDEEHKEQEARAKANAAIKAQAEAEERLAQAKTKAAKEKAQREADDQAAIVLQQQKAAEEAEAQAQAAAVDVRVADQRAESVEGPAKVAGYRHKELAPWVISDFSKIPPALLDVVLLTNDKVINDMIKTGAITEAKHGGWITINRGTGVARSK